VIFTRKNHLAKASQRVSLRDMSGVIKPLTLMLTAWEFFQWFKNVIHKLRGATTETKKSMVEVMAAS